jgi:hypothetical protein
MCPACLTTLALIATGSTSVGGLTAFAVNMLYSSTDTTTIAIPSPSKRRPGYDHDDEAQDRNTRGVARSPA